MYLSIYPMYNYITKPQHVLLSDKFTKQGKPNIILSNLDFYIFIYLYLALMFFVDELFGKA